MRRLRLAGASIVVFAIAAAEPPVGPGGPVDEVEARRWIAEMRRSPKGPFEAIRWFCRDGSVLPPRAGACTPHGGGRQHGLLSPRARALRESGYWIANVLAALEPEGFVGADADPEPLRQLVLERFLIALDDGWIFRGARNYRGALQSEDEEAAAERLLATLLGDPGWRAPSRYLLLREIARALPSSRRSDVARDVRNLASRLAEVDPDFAPLRAAIHGAPQAEDAARVRDYANRRTEPEEYQRLAAALDTLFTPASVREELEPLIAAAPRAEADALRTVVGQLASDDPERRLVVASRALADFRRQVAAGVAPRSARRLLAASLVLEREAFASAQSLLTRQPTRRALLDHAATLAEALFGTGLVGARQLAALEEAFATLAGKSVALRDYRDTVAYAMRAAEWSRRALRFQFGPSVDRLERIEPRTALYEPDRLRGSPLLPFSEALDLLARDAQTLGGARSRVLGASVATGLRGLNAGVGRGRVRIVDTPEDLATLTTIDVAVLPDTFSELPPVAAILTRGEGSSLSHVQLLARNLGIPNALVDEAIASALEGVAGEWVEVVVSAGGIVQIDAGEPPTATTAEPSEAPIEIDVDRLDLARRELVPLDELRAADSGRLCGPKAANLGELRARFGARVPDGFVVPFGVFRALLDEPIAVSGATAFAWLHDEYRRIETLEAADRPAATRGLLAQMRSWIGERRLPPELREEVAQRIAALGAGGLYVRSDTNVEDLPGFTGAGLNRTVPNVVGADAVLRAILEVWASPFTERAHAWRQANMDRPEWVLPSVLVQRAVPAEVSGVMVTVDVDGGDPGFLSIASSEGVGGAVDGQAAEAIRIERATGRVRLLAQATAPYRRVLAAEGGTVFERASGREQLLGPREIDALRQLAEDAATFPALARADGDFAPADIEFAFVDGELSLLQLRPFVGSRRAAESERLRALDASLAASASKKVRLDRKPAAGGP